MNTGDRQTTAVGFSAGLATILMWQLGFHWPAMMADAPAGLEAAFVGVIATTVARWFRRKPEPPPPEQPNEDATP